MIVIDATNTILGRLATRAAKELVKGEKVVVINAEKAIISGNKDYIFKKYKQRVDRADIANPRKGPKFPRRPDLLVRRTIRGMLPKTNRGRNLLRNLRVFIGSPEDYKDVTKIKTNLYKGDYITVEELAKMLGWKG